MIKYLFISLLVFLAGSLMANQYFQAEDYENSSVAPFVVKTDSKASGGRYVVYENGPIVEVPGDAQPGQLHYTFTVKNTGDVALWLRAFLPDNLNDSYWYKLEGSNFNVEWTRFNDKYAPRFDWMRMIKFKGMPAGTYTLKILPRETGAKLDAFFVSEDGSLPLGIQKENIIYNTALYLEAEAIRQGKYFSPFSIQNDNLASGGKYITQNTTGNSNGSPADNSNGQAVFTFTNRSLGDVTVWARIWAPSADDNEFYFKMEGTDNWQTHTAPVTTGWVWTQLKTYPALSENTHQLKLLIKEDGLKLDKLYLTTNTDAPGSYHSQYLEAESASAGNTFSPLIAVHDDLNTSMGTYITWPNNNDQENNNVTDQSDAQARYTIVVEQEQVTAEVFARVNFKANDNAIYFKWFDKEEWQTFEQTTSGWQWVKLATYQNVSAGSYTFGIAGKKDGIRIDQLFVSYNGKQPENRFQVPADGENANTFFVAPFGNDNNNGKYATPWKTIEKAMNSLTQGQKVYVRQGVYTINETLKPANSGTTNQPIIFTGYPGETAIIDAANASGDAIKISQKANIVIDGFEIRDANDYGIRTYIAENIVIRNNTIIRAFNSGVLSSGASQLDHVDHSKNITIEYNKIIQPNDNYRSGAGISQEGITIGRTDGFTIQHNELAFGRKEGIDVKGASRNGKVLYNHVHHLYNWPTVAGIYVDNYVNTSFNTLDELHRIYNIEVGYNHVHDCGGIVISTETGHPVRDISIHHNLSYNTSHNAGIKVAHVRSVNSPISMKGYTRNVRVYNNTIFNTFGGIVITDEPYLDSIYIYNNIMSNSYKGDLFQGDINSLTHKAMGYDLFQGNSNYKGDNAITGDPLFKNPELYDFHLTQGSPAIDAGHPDAFYNDPDGSRNDVGAFPYGGGSGCTVTLSASSHNFSADAGNTTITVTTSESFTVSDDQDWISVSKDGDQVTITVTENTGTNSRSGTVTIAGCSNKTLTITQAGKDDTGGSGSCANGEASFTQSAGEVVIEAENFDGSDQKNDVVAWQTGNTQSGFSGTAYVYIEEGATNFNTGTIESNASLSYHIEFTSPGTYTIWLRRWAPDEGGNSVFTTLGGVQSTGTDNDVEVGAWLWKSLGTVTVSSAGMQQLELIRREDGYMVDKIVINSGEKPTNEGPEETTCISTGIDDMAAENTIKIYPNPASLNITVDLENYTTEVLSVELINSLGQRVYQSKERNRQIQITTSGLPGGIYSIVIHTNNERLVRKVVIQPE